MMRSVFLALLAAALLSPANAAQLSHPGGGKVVALDRDLTQLKNNFNAAKGSVRLVFIIGPTCGICLRGMADFNEALLAERQGDDRLQTFAVHVPVLGATEADAKNSLPLMQGANIYHYWDPSGIVGQDYMEVLGTGNVYAWDVWIAYGPDAEWKDASPPAPAFWQHQLPSLPDALYLDAKDFASKTVALMDTIGSGGGARASTPSPGMGAVGVDFVVQGPGRAAQTYVEVALGGKDNIESLAAYEMKGELVAGGTRRPLSVRASRPNALERSAIALPPSLAVKLDETFDFEGVLYGWENKKNRLAPHGMVSLKEGLAWRFDMSTPSHEHWELLVDSHTGSLLRQRLLAPEGPGYRLEVSYADFSKVGGILFPHRIEYRDGNGALIATEIFSEIELFRN
jgi:hypothetical protein